MPALLEDSSKLWIHAWAWAELGSDPISAWAFEEGEMQPSPAVCTPPCAMCAINDDTTYLDQPEFLSLDKEGFSEHLPLRCVFHLCCLSFPLYWKLTPGVHFCVLRPKSTTEFLKSQWEKDSTFLPIIPCPCSPGSVSSPHLPYILF